MNFRTLALLLLVTLAQPLWTQAAEEPAQVSGDSPALTTRLALRDLWVEHIFWTRNYAFANQQHQKQEAEAAGNEVVANAKSIANSIAPLYGQPAADQLLELLAGHWGAVKHYSDASVAKDADGRKAAVNDLTRNA